MYFNVQPILQLIYIAVIVDIKGSDKTVFKTLQNDNFTIQVQG